MSVKKYVPTLYNTDVTELVEWLNSNKTGTLLENAEIVKTTSSQFTISLGNVVIDVRTTETAVEGYDSITYTYDNSTTRKYNIKRTGSPYYVSKARVFLCSNGAIFKCFIGGTSYTWFSVTKDRDGQLAVIYPYPNTQDGGQYTGYRAILRDSLDYQVNQTPRTNPDFTDIVNMVVGFGDGTTAELPYIYASRRSQISSDGSMEVVTLNGNTYITDGRWFVKDE